MSAQQALLTSGKEDVIEITADMVGDAGPGRKMAGTDNPPAFTSSMKGLAPRLGTF
jgi:hypothetical protein